MSLANLPELLTPAQVAKALNIPVKTVVAKCARGACAGGWLGR